jgi:hypothetical protein
MKHNNDYLLALSRVEFFLEFGDPLRASVVFFAVLVDKHVQFAAFFYWTMLK